MEIETYLIEEAEQLICDPDQLDEYKELIDELGLEGQRELIGAGGTPCPFPAMTAEDKRMWETVFSEKTDLRSFSNEMIPLRVLSLAALAEREKYFEQIQVWHEPNVDDPILVGCKNRVWYLIARWGKALIPVEQIYEMALKKKARSFERSAEDGINQLRAIAESGTNLAKKWLETGSTGIWISPT